VSFFCLQSETAWQVTGQSLTLPSAPAMVVQRSRVTFAESLDVVTAVLLNIHVFCDVTPTMSVTDALNTD
jgi:hypothetical protein